MASHYNVGREAGKQAGRQVGRSVVYNEQIQYIVYDVIIWGHLKQCTYVTIFTQLLTLEHVCANKSATASALKCLYLQAHTAHTHTHTHRYNKSVTPLSNDMCVWKNALTVNVSALKCRYLQMLQTLRTDAE